MKETHDMTAPRTEWAVTVEMNGPEPLDDDRLDQLLEHLADHHVGGVATRAGQAWFSTTITVTATTPARAVDTAVKAIVDAVHGSWSPVLAEVMTLERQEAELAEPALPELAGVAEAAEILGVTKQRVSAMVASTPGFPEPVQRLRIGPLWRRSALEAFAAKPRRGGRPAKVEESAEVDESAVARAIAVAREHAVLPHRMTAARRG